MGKHILPVNVSTINWIDIGHAIRMESRFSKVCRESRVRQPPCGSFEILSGRVWLRLLLSRLRSLLDVLFVDPHLPVMILLLLRCSQSLRHILLLLSRHESLRTHEDLIVAQVLANYVNILSVIKSVVARLLRR